MSKPILLGAVVYDPRVVLIWDIIKAYFNASGCPMDYVFYSNYELQTRALLEGQIQIAWQSPLAWLDTVRQAPGSARAIAMRDTDRDRVSHIVCRTENAPASVAELRGRRLGLGAWDSPQAALIPLNLLRSAGLDPARDLDCRRFDVLVGKHGDHIGGERDALDALKSGQLDACAMLDLNWETWCADGSIDRAGYRILATTGLFDHCVFAVLDHLEPDHEDHWLRVLFSMDYSNPDHREMMDMEGLKAWLPGRTSGFAELSRAVHDENFFERRDAGEWSTAAGKVR
ncbi:MAG: PhnD/SsuA/transferrin family substrate-binding protein [Candidatus Cloacimonetes bacterium]|nr:PhnD/SsuA/transferrin family substrate-binding protein [Candidatus Cloacimonadota bacterium]